MNVAKEELEFRRALSAMMKGLWHLTWHEDGAVNPGVPDLSYVMKNGDYETGWLELKAKKSKQGYVTFTIERSQHEWFTAHHDLIPAHFLCEVDGICYLINGRHHELLAGRNIPASRLLSISDYAFRLEDARQTLHDALKTYTFRGRHNGRTG